MEGVQPRQTFVPDLAEVQFSPTADDLISDPVGPLEVSNDVIHNFPGLTQAGSKDVFIYYPTAPGNYPVISWQHGMGDNGRAATAYKSLLTLLASNGFIVLGDITCPEGFCQQLFEDELAVLHGACNQPSLHPALASADCSKTGIGGHSMGAMATTLAAKQSGYNIAAAVSMHPCRASGQGINVPLLMTAGSADTLCADGCAYKVFQQASGPKAFLDAEGAPHMEPSDNKGGQHSVNNAAMLWYSCYLKAEHCDKVMGDAICNQLVGRTPYLCEHSGNIRPAPSPSPKPPSPKPPSPKPPSPSPSPTPSPTPSPSGCPGGTLPSCIALCPSIPDSTFSACIMSCGTRCSNEMAIASSIKDMDGTAQSTPTQIKPAENGNGATPTLHGVGAESSATCTKEGFTCTKSNPGQCCPGLDCGGPGYPTFVCCEKPWDCFAKPW